ncbi:MAG: Flp pilus assembly protein CpaB [bacterium]|nr:Flp pilus assembly protein CpaB [bacterium]
MKSKTAILLAIISALLGIFLVMSYITGVEERSALDSDLKSVVVAKRYIPGYSLLSLDMIKVSQIPSKYLQPGSITSPKELVDKAGNPKFITVVPVMEGEVLLSTKFMLPSMETGLSVVVPMGQRAVSLPVEESMTSSGLIKPGNRIDLIGTFGDKSVYVLQNLLVLSVRNKIIGEIQRKTKKSSFIESITEEAAGGGAITVAVTPEQALKIAYAKDKCVFNLALRNMSDFNMERINYIDQYNLLDIKVKPIESVKVYKGIDKIDEFLK